MVGIRLRLAKEPQWIEIADGGAVLCRPPTTMLVATARHRAEEMMVELREGVEAVTRLGGVIGGVPDLSDDEHEASARQAAFIIALGELAITDWRNILSEDGAPLDFDETLVAALLEDDRRAQIFLLQYLDPLRAAEAEGNA